MFARLKERLQKLYPSRQDVTQGQFLNGVKLVRIQNFPFRLVAKLKLKNPVSPTIYPYIAGEEEKVTL